MVFPQHLKNLTAMIKKEKAIKEPLIVEKEHFIVLDGSHRHIFLALEGYKYSPVILVDYTDPNIRVGTHRIHRHLVKGPINISKNEVIERGTAGNLFPPRTTRHFFPFLRPKIHIPLETLAKGKPIKKLRKNISNATIEEEIQHNERYVQEIYEETSELLRYFSEIWHNREYLLEQIRRMKKSQ